MISEQLNPAICFLNLDVKSMEDVMRTMGGKMTQEGYAKDSYPEALIEREKEYPTGLDTGSIAVAMPHTATEHVLKAGVAVATLKNPVTFTAMGTDDEFVQVELVFMLAVADGHAHLDELQALMAMFQDEEVLKNLKAAQTPEDIINIIKNKENQGE